MKRLQADRGSPDTETWRKNNSAAREAEEKQISPFLTAGDKSGRENKKTSGFCLAAILTSSTAVASGEGCLEAVGASVQH